MNLSDRPIRLTAAAGLAAMVAVISLTEGSLFVGVLVTAALLAVSAGVLLAGSYFVRTASGTSRNRSRATNPRRARAGFSGCSPLDRGGPASVSSPSPIRR